MPALYKLETLQDVPFHLALVDEARVTVQAASAATGRIRRLLTAIVEPFSRLGPIESLDPRFRARQSAREKALTDANLHCPCG
jgi:hypothetical protein